MKSGVGGVVGVLGRAGVCGDTFFEHASPVRILRPNPWKHPGVIGALFLQGKPV